MFRFAGVRSLALFSLNFRASTLEFKIFLELFRRLLKYPLVHCNHPQRNKEQQAHRTESWCQNRQTFLSPPYLFP